MRIISKKQTQLDNKSVFLCKDVNDNNLGREVYADNIDTPYSFYLIRELKLVRDYQSLAEGEAFFDAICDSWDTINDFDDLVVKKIYMYVETEVMYYSLFIGSFKPTRSNLRFRLKEWLADIKVEKQERLLSKNNDLMVGSTEMQDMMNQMLETSNEIFRLRKIINDLNTTIENEKIEKKIAANSENPVISRSIRTIHLKRAQPLLLDDELESTPEYHEKLDQVTIEKKTPLAASDKDVSFGKERIEETPEKKLQAGGIGTTSTQGNTQIEDRNYNSQKKNKKLTMIQH